VRKAPMFTKYPSTRVEAHPVLAGWWRRVFATLVDAAFAVGIILGAIALGADGEHVNPAFVLGALAVIYLHYVLGHGSRSGQTLGKRVFGIAVRNAAGGRIGYGRSFLRLVAALVIGWIPLVGLISLVRPWWHTLNRTYHDSVAKTIVVRA
jgi:uncharacterized RDD family membrane protein YckC